MEAEENDSSRHGEESSLLSVDDDNINLDVMGDTHEELQGNEEQHCAFKSAINEMELPPNASVESLQQLNDTVPGNGSFVAEIEKKDAVEIAEEKAFCIEDMTEHSAKLENEPEMGLLGQMKEDAVAEEKSVAEFGEGEMLNEMVMVGVADNQVEGSVLMANFSENKVGCSGITEETWMTDVLDEGTLAETSVFVTDVTNSAGKIEVEENADEPHNSKNIEVPMEENVAMEDRELGVSVQLVVNSEYKVSLVDGTVAEEGWVDQTGEMLKMENLYSNTDEVGLTSLDGESDGDINMENVEGKIVENSEMCKEEATNVAMMEKSADETLEIEGVDVTDNNIEVLKIENAEVREVGVQGSGVAVESAEVADTDNVEDKTTAQLEELAMVEDAEEADDIVYLVHEGSGSEETDANMTEAAEEVGNVVEPSKRSGGAKRKRGKDSKAPARVPSRKKVEEDVCFICFDGGELVLCDRRGCPKAYHPSCINRDEAFFRGRWYCGWHLCSNCEKTAHYMCYTCTFSLCKSCIKKSVILCVRGNKGFCETCIKFVMLIEKNEQGNTEKGQIDFNQKNSWEYLYKEYWAELKGSLSLTFDELVHAKSPWKGSETLTSRPGSPGELFDGNVDGGSETDVSENEESGSSKKRKAKKRSKSHAKETTSPSMPNIPDSQGLSTDINAEWASKELLEFVMHMKNGDRTALSQFDVQALLLVYIKRNKLRDPRRKSQIICDSRLENLFGKPRVGHFEMLKLLESHFLIKEDAQISDLQWSVADTESSQLETDGHTDASGKNSKEKKRRARRKGDGRGLQSNLDDYAAIDIHNINLIYLKRNLVEYLIEDEESLHEKAVGSFVRIRISGNAQKQDLYRLVQVVGTSKASEPYKVGKKMTEICLEILNLNKTEVISIDIISNQEFSEEECKRLRQSIKCGILNRLTVGDVHERAMSLQDARVKDWMETEIVRLSHLRDRASEKGRRKELRECVEKLQLLKSPEERQRRLEEIPEIHTDPNMDPSHESEDEDEADEKRLESYTLSRGSSFSRRTREPVSPGKGGSNLNDSWSGTRSFSNANRDLSRNLSGKGFSNHGDDAIGSGEIINENYLSQGRERDVKQTNKWDKQQVSPGSEKTAGIPLSGAATELSSAARSVNPAASPSVGTAKSAAVVNETEKIWHYRDPSGKVQGPFSMVQLRKWSNTGYFPADLKVWRTSDKQEDAMILTDILAGKIPKDTPVDNNFQVHTHASSVVAKTQGTTLQSGMDGQNTGTSNPLTNPISYGQSSGGRWTSQNEVSPTGRPVSAAIEVPRYSGDKWSTNHGNKNFTNLPSPTPSSGGTKDQPFQVAASFASSGGGGSSFHGSSLVQGSENNPLHSHSGLNSAEKSMGLGAINALQNYHSQSLRGPITDDASVNPAADIKSISANLHSLVQSISNRNPSIETQKVEPNNSSSTRAAQPRRSRWGEMLPEQNGATSFSAGNSASNFSMPGLTSFPNNPPHIQSSNPHNNQPQIQSSTQHNSQPHIQSSIPPSVPWGMGAPDGQSIVPRPGSESQNQSWGPVPSGNPNVGWSASAPPNGTGLMWGSAAQSSAHVGTNPGWIAPGQGPPTSNNNIQGWQAHGPMPPLVNTTPGWVAPNLRPMPPMNVNANWPVPSANQGMWSNEHGKNGDRFSNQKNGGGSHGGDPGNGGKSWGMQPSYGGGVSSSSRLPYNNKGICKYHESGHCKKGGSCDFRH